MFIEQILHTDYLPSDSISSSTERTTVRTHYENVYIEVLPN